MSCPEDPAKDVLKWMVLTFIGTQGGRTSYGNVRHVYYSNTASPLIKEIIVNEAEVVRDWMHGLENDKDIKRRIADQHIARRFEKLLDLVE